LLTIWSPAGHQRGTYDMHWQPCSEEEAVCSWACYFGISVEADGLVMQLCDHKACPAFMPDGHYAHHALLAVGLAHDTQGQLAAICHDACFSAATASDLCFGTCEHIQRRFGCGNAVGRLGHCVFAECFVACKHATCILCINGDLPGASTFQRYSVAW
jgi:hypothetical protein